MADCGKRRTESLCPVCLRRVQAAYEPRGEDVWLTKRCPEHGEFAVVAWRGAPSMDGWSRPKIPLAKPLPAASEREGCPFDCAACDSHGQRTCTAVLDVTSRCDLGCPICFADARPHGPADPSPKDVERMLRAVMARSGSCNIQFSGGEPTLRPDLPDLVSLAARLGFGFVQLNTNGLRLGREAGYAARLAGAGLSSVFLQFDGVSDAVHQTLRGGPLLDLKLRAVEACVRAGIGVVLVPTLVPGINDNQVGDILRLALEHAPGVRGVHFQPASAFGRHPWDGATRERLTLPEVVAFLAAQSGGLVRAADFHPPGCEHSLCSFSATYVLGEGGGLEPLPSNGGCCTPAPVPAPIPAEEGSRKATAFVARQWGAHKAPQQAAEPVGDFERFIAQAAARPRFCISGMAFQDAWNIDLERVRGCCIHSVSPGGALIPFCLYNLTASDGRTLYRGTPC